MTLFRGHFERMDRDGDGLINSQDMADYYSKYVGGCARRVYLCVIRA